jgi:hypothetical protein
MLWEAQCRVLEQSSLAAGTSFLLTIVEDSR